MLITANPNRQSPPTTEGRTTSEMEQIIFFPVVSIVLMHGLEALTASAAKHMLTIGCLLLYCL